MNQEVLKSRHIVSDPLGVKPVYFCPREGSLVFSHDLRTLFASSSVPVRPNEWAILEYLRKGRQDHTGQTFFEGISRLLPGQEVQIDSNGHLAIRTYWEPRVSSEIRSRQDDFSKIRHMFFEAIRRDLPSDGPIAVSLSGGLDSSAIVAGISVICPDNEIKTFSVVYPEWKYLDESKYAEFVSQHFHTEHHLIAPKADDFWDALPQLVRCQEEPFASISAYSDWEMMRHVRGEGMKKLIGGLGSDAVLCGEPRYVLYYLLTLLKRKEYSLLVTETLRGLDQVRTLLNENLKDFTKYGYKIAPHFFSAISPRSSLSMPQRRDAPDLLVDQMKIDISRHVLPSELRCLYRNARWFGIDTRSPFLYLPFFEYLSSLPIDMKLRNGWTKYALRRALKGILPDEIRLRRDKVGFATPAKEWFSDPLRDRLISFFNGSLRATRYYDVEALRVTLNSSKSLSEFQSAYIWRILNLEIWFQEFFPN